MKKKECEDCKAMSFILRIIVYVCFVAILCYQMSSIDELTKFKKRTEDSIKTLQYDRELNTTIRWRMEETLGEIKQTLEESLSKQDKKEEKK